LILASRPFNADFSYLCLGSLTLVKEQSKQSNDMGMGMSFGEGHGTVLHHSISVTDTFQLQLQESHTPSFDPPTYVGCGLCL
jgi:hypothetical protein